MRSPGLHHVLFARRRIGRAHPHRQPGEDSAEQAAGGIQCAANGADGPAWKTGADAGSAAVAEKFKMEPAIR